jgi:hypothetical protein
MPFANAYERAIHFAKHGHEFGATTELDYEHMAETFLNRPMTITTRECLRSSRTRRLRVNIANDHFGVAVAASTPSSHITLFHFTESIGAAA